MPLSMTRQAILPHDTNTLPKPGSPEQLELIADEEQIADATYLDTLRSFDSLAEEIYPEVARQCVLALTTVRGPSLTPLRVLDLGAGLALESQALLDQGVHMSRLCLNDYSAKTLELAKQMFAAHPRRAQIDALDTVALDLLAARLTDHFEPGSFDLVITCNSFMHFPREEHARLFREVHTLLAPDGVFLFQSHFKVVAPNWKQHIIGGMQSHMRTQGAPDALIAQAGNHLANFHHFHDLHAVYNWLESARFDFFECVYRQRMLGMFVAIK